MKRSFALNLSIAVLLLGTFARHTQAATIINQTFSGPLPTTIAGTLPNQDTALEESFTLPSPSTLRITTTSYATGGFETNLLLFNSMGNFVTAGVPFGTPDPRTGIVGDQRLTAINLAAGMYTLALTDVLLNQSLTATNLSAGFADNFGNGTTFVDALGNQRTGNFAFTISADAASAVPEPNTVWLAAPVLAVLALCARKRSKLAPEFDSH